MSSEHKLNSIAKDIRKHGMSKATFVAVESLSPGILSDQGICEHRLTDRFSDVGRSESLAAMESGFLKSAGLVAGAVGIFGLLIKFFMWLKDKISSSGGGSGSVMSDSADTNKVSKEIKSTGEKIKENVKKLNDNKGKKVPDSKLKDSGEVGKFKSEIGGEVSNMTIVRYLNKKLADNPNKDKIIKKATSLKVNPATAVYIATLTKFKVEDVKAPISVVLKVVDTMVALIGVTHDIVKDLSSTISGINPDKFDESVLERELGALEKRTEEKLSKLMTTIIEAESKYAHKDNNKILTLLDVDNAVGDVGPHVAKLEDMLAGDIGNELAKLYTACYSAHTNFKTNLDKINTTAENIEIDEQLESVLRPVVNGVSKEIIDNLKGASVLFFKMMKRVDRINLNRHRYELITAELLKIEEKILKE